MPTTPHSVHDFGKNIIPGTIASGRVYAYPFQDVKTAAQAYWRDVGTVDAFYEANMELVYVTPELNLYDEDWPIWTYQEHVPSAKFVLDEDGRRGEAINSLVSGGCIISGATVRESLLFFNSHVEERSEVYSFRAPAPRAHRAQLLDQQGHPRRRLRGAGWHADRRGRRGGLRAISRDRARRRAGHA